MLLIGLKIKDINYKMIMENKKIFIIGAAHSGTTILYNMLAYHNELAWFSQFSQRNKDIPDRKRLIFSNIYKRNMRKIKRHSWKKAGRSVGIPFPSEAKVIWDYIFSFQDDKERKEILREIINEELKTWQKSHILFKKPSLGDYIDFFYETFGDEAYFIHIIRDGRAVILSDLHKFHKNCSIDEALSKTIDYWKGYIDVIDSFKSKYKSKNIFEIRYEDFIKDIHSNIKTILKFCDIDSNTYAYNSIPKSLKSTNNKWINEKNDDLIKNIEMIANDILTKYGYIFD